MKFRPVIDLAKLAEIQNVEIKNLAWETYVGGCVDTGRDIRDPSRMHPMDDKAIRGDEVTNHKSLNIGVSI